MFKLITVRVLFAIGLVIIVFLSGGGLIPSSMMLYVIIVYTLFCELAIAHPIKARIAPPLSISKKSLAMLPWLFPFAAMALALLNPSLFHADSIPAIPDAQFQLDGRQIGKEAAGLITYARMGAMGAADPDCKDVVFLAPDVNVLFQRTVAPIFEVVARKEGQTSDGLPMMLAQFQQEFESREAIETREVVYRRLKAQAIQAYGADDHCAALSSTLATVVHQKQLLLDTLATTK